MQRRKFLHLTGGIALTGSLAGCSSLTGDTPTSTQDDSEPSPTTQPTPEPEPSLEWSEEYLGNEQFRLNVTVELDGANRIKFVRIPMSDPDDKPNEYITTVSQSGTHSIAGPNSEYGPIDLAAMVYAAIRDGSGKTTIPVGKKIGDYIVGSDTTVSEMEQQDRAASPTFLDGVSGDTLPDLSTSESYRRTFSQTTRSGGTEFTTGVLKPVYQYYKSRPRVPDYGMYTSDMFDNHSIENIAGEFEDYGNRKNHTDRQIVDHAIAWVQGMEYTQDKPATGYNEYPKYPAETIVDRGGDCEDTSILLSEVLRDLGYGTVLLKLDQANHMAVGVSGSDDIPGSYYTYRGQRFYYVETTGSGWRVGEVPEDVKRQGSNAEIVEINQSPSLALEWKAVVPQSGGLRVYATGHNVGETTARNAKLQVDIESEDGRLVGQKRKLLPSVPVEGNKTKTFEFEPPADQPLRLRFGALLGDSLVDMDDSGLYRP